MMRPLAAITGALFLVLLDVRTSFASAVPPDPTTGLHLVDWTIVGAYLLLTLGIGWYFGRKQESTEQYFVGNRRMNPFLMGISLFATLLSTISYLSMPGETLGKGPMGLLQNLALPFVFLIVGYVMLPVYMRQRVTSAYELLEVRLGLSIRLLGATMFLLLRLVWMSLLIHLSAKALVSMMDFPEDVQARAMQVVALGIGFVAVVYTSVGGLRAVVITDLLQAILLYGGALLVIGTVTYKMGGFGWFPTEWQSHWDVQPWFSLDPGVRLTVCSAALSYLLWNISTLGGDQTSVQRFMAVRDLAAARRMLATQLAVAVTVALTLGVVGFAIMGYFSQPNVDVPGGSLTASADFLFPHFIAHHLPIGISGLVVSAMFAAAMSSIDSGVNSITAVVVTDFLDRFGRKPSTERGHVLLARTLAFAIGATVVIGSAFMGNVPGNITAVTGKTSNLLTTPIFALFFFALFVPFARPAGVWAGAICGTLVAVTIAFSGPLVVWLNRVFEIPPESFGVGIVSKIDKATGRVWQEATHDPVSFLWIAPVALSVNLLVGTLVSLWIGGPKPASPDLKND